MDWQPIETAPKDGSHIWVFANGKDDMGEDITWQGVIYWMNFLLMPGQPASWACLPRLNPEFKYEDDKSVWQPAIVPEPTHWMPLPPPPSSEEVG